MGLNKLYTPKQIEILKACRNNDWFMLVNHGAKRSGKTQLDNDLFLQELIKVRKTADSLGIDTPQYILAGYTMGNIQDNILTELSNKYGLEFKFDKFNNFHLFGVKVVQTSTGSIGGLGRIRGIHDLATSVERLAASVEQMAHIQHEHTEQIDRLESRDAEMWRKVVGHAITVIVGIVIGYIFTQIGM